MNFMESKTRENLMRAFAGESQARNRYTFAAQAAYKQRQYLIAQVFEYTASQEKEHADIFWKLLKECDGTTIHIDGGYPVQTTDDLLVQLRDSVHNETEEAVDVYPAFAKIAQEEGFQRAADVFNMIAKIEQTHANRFERFQNALGERQLFQNGGETSWMCLNCGYIYEGADAPAACPVCSHERGYFIRTDLTPFKGV